MLKILKIRLPELVEIWERSDQTIRQADMIFLSKSSHLCLNSVYLKSKNFYGLDHYAYWRVIKLTKISFGQICYKALCDTWTENQIVKRSN